MATDPIVEFEAVTKAFVARVAVRDLSFRVAPGTIQGLIGPNGSGKTTTLRLVLNLFYPDQGSIRVLGRAPEGRASDRVGYLPEERGLYRKMGARQVLLYYARLKGARASRRDVDEWLDRLGILDAAEQRVEALSKGTAQKVQFIGAVISRPELLVLDEPFTGLDPLSADLLREAVLALKRDGATILLSTHDMAVAEAMCDAVVMLHRGRKVLDGTREQIEAEQSTSVIRVRADSLPPGLPGVERIVDRGGFHELFAAAGADPQQILRYLVSRTAVRSFEIARPSLHDVFVRLAGE